MGGKGKKEVVEVVMMGGDKEGSADPKGLTVDLKSKPPNT